MSAATRAGRCLALLTAAWLGTMPALQAQSDDLPGRGVRENAARVKAWNQFADRLLAVHEARLQRHPVRSSAREGGYGDSIGGPRYFREVEYREAGSDRLLSRVRWVRGSPGTAHVIEIPVHDERGRVVRDYVAAYLPRFRNAPFQTLINLHDYNEGLHAFRQFDASGERIYESCRGRYFDEPVNLTFEYHELPGVEAGQQDPVIGELYTACFGFIAAVADDYLDPRVEIAVTGTGKAEPGGERLGALTREIEADPGAAPLYVRRGRAHFEAQDFERAIADLDRAIALQPQLDAAWFWRGMALGRARRFDEALADLTVFIERNPASSLAYTKRGIRHFWSGDVARAERDLGRAIELDPDNAEAHDDLGVIFAQRGEIDRAIEQFSTTLRLDPTYQKAYHNLALARYMQGRAAAALTVLDQGLALAEDRGSVLLRARILRDLGREAEARTAEQRAASLPDVNWSESAEVH